MNWLQQIINNIHDDSGKTITIASFAKKCDLPKSTVTRIIKGNRSINALTLSVAEQLANGLGLEITDFLEKYYKKGGELDVLSD